MLNGLDDIPWHTLSHAYGPAGDVPAQLRALLSDDPHVRGAALRRCYANIFHQGSRFEASTPAVPFLLDMLADPATPDRADIAELIASLAVGYDELWLPESIAVAQLSAVELGVYRAAAEGVPLYRSLLTEGPPTLRKWAAYLLGWFPSPDAVPALTAAADDADELVAATAIISLGLTGAEVPSVTREIPWVAAAIAAARVHGRAASPPVVDELLRWSSGAAGPGRLPLPHYEGDVAGYATLALQQVLDDSSAVALDTLVARIPTVSGLDAMPVVGEALRRAFRNRGLPSGTPFKSLDERQQRVVRALAESPDTWRFDGALFANFSQMVRAYGLPGSAAEMRDYASSSTAP